MMIVRARPIAVVVSALQASIDVPTENARDVLDKSMGVDTYAIARSAFGAEAQLPQRIQNTAPGETEARTEPKKPQNDLGCPARLASPGLWPIIPNPLEEETRWPTRVRYHAGQTLRVSLLLPPLLNDLRVARLSTTGCAACGRP
jgi:hypothetical protein